MDEQQRSDRDTAPALPAPEAVARDLRVRRYRPADRQWVWELHNAALTQVGAHGGNGAWDDDLHHIEREYLDSGGEFLVAVLRGRIVGMGALRLVDDGVGELKRMRVDPGLHRRGIGQRLLTALLHAAAARGCHTLRLDTTARQTGARGLYRKNGFVEVERRSWRGFEVILFEKRLAPGNELQPEE